MAWPNSYGFPWKKNTFPTIRCFFFGNFRRCQSRSSWPRWHGSGGLNASMGTVNRCENDNLPKVQRLQAVKEWSAMIRNMKDDERDVCLLFVCFLLLPPCKMWGVMMVEMPKCNWFLFFFFLIFWWFQHVPKVFMFTSIWWIWSQCHNGTLFPPFLCFWDWNHQLEMIIVHREAAHPESSGVLGGLSRRQTLQSGFWCSLTVEQRWKKGKTWRQENTPKTNILNPKNWWFVHVRKWEELTNLCNWKKWLGEQVFEVLFLMRWRCCW